MIHIIEHTLGLCSDSNSHTTFLGLILESQNINHILTYIKTWRK
jgi:hypothetical protein